MCAETSAPLLLSYFMYRVWAISGEGVDMGEEASRWVSQFLGLDGCRLYYMAPHHRARVLKQDHEWDEITRHGEEVIYFCC